MKYYHLKLEKPPLSDDKSVKVPTFENSIVCDLQTNNYFKNVQTKTLQRDAGREFITNMVSKITEMY